MEAPCLMNFIAPKRFEKGDGFFQWTMLGGIPHDEGARIIPFDTHTVQSVLIGIGFMLCSESQRYVLM